MGGTLLARLDAKTDKSGDCWLWIGGKQWQGYGKAWVNGRTVPAHRARYELEHGPVPAGLVLDHICYNPTCVNPAHLEPVTQSENVKRARRVRRTDCRFAHGATFIDAHGNPRCRVCHNARQREYRARKAGGTSLTIGRK